MVERETHRMPSPRDARKCEGRPVVWLVLEGEGCSVFGFMSVKRGGMGLRRRSGYMQVGPFSPLLCVMSTVSAPLAAPLHSFGGGSSLCTPLQTCSRHFVKPKGSAVPSVHQLTQLGVMSCHLTEYTRYTATT